MEEKSNSISYITHRRCLTLR